MPFLLSHPAAAWLFPAVALPILFHLFFRLRRQVREFPSLMFFLRIDPRLSAKRKIHEWLILLLRCLFIALLIFALIRPLIGLRSSAENVARLVLIDNSGSMAAATAGDTSKLTLAERATEKLMALSRPGDSIAVQLMLPDPTVTLPQGFDASPALLRDAIGKLTPSDGAASIPKAIRVALATLDSAKAPQRELHIFTDLQQKNWSRGDLDAQAGNYRIIVHRIQSAPVSTGSVSLEPAGIPTRSIPVGRITPVRIVLQNHGPIAAHVRLNSSDDSGKNISRDVQVMPNAPTTTALTFSFPTPGFHWAQVWVEGDAAPTANRTELGFWCGQVQKVLFAGDKTDFGAMPNALSPGGNADLSGIDGTFVGAGQLQASLAEKPLAVVLAWENWPHDGGLLQALQDYVREGGTLFLVPTPAGDAAIPHLSAEWLDANPEPRHTPTEAEPVVLSQDGDAIWRDLRDADGRPHLGLLRVFQYRPINLGVGNWQVLISSAKGGALFARRNLEKGRIFASGLAFTPKWSSLPLKGGFVVLMQNAAFGDQAEHIPVQEVRAGEGFHFDLPSGLAAIKSLAGSALDWQGQVREFEGLPRAGVYEISQHNQVSWVAVSANPDEADPHFLPVGQVALLHNLPHEVLTLASADDITTKQLTKNSGTSLYRYLLLAALILLIAETWLANERSSDLGRKLFRSLLPGALQKKPASKRTTELTRV